MSLDALWAWVLVCMIALAVCVTFMFMVASIYFVINLRELRAMQKREREFSTEREQP